MTSRASALLTLLLLTAAAHVNAAPYEFEDTIKTLDAATARVLLTEIHGRGEATAATAAAALALELTGAIVTGPDDDDLRDPEVQKSDRFYAFEFDAQLSGAALPCGLRRPGKVTAHLVKRAGRWWPDNSLAWYLKTSHCGP